MTVDRNLPVEPFGLATVAHHDGSGRILDTRHPDTERWWLPILGPTAITLARLAVDPGTPTIDAAHEWLGVKPKVARDAADRLCRFGWATWTDPRVLGVVTAQYPPSPQQANRLPMALKAAAAAPWEPRPPRRTPEPAQA